MLGEGGHDHALLRCDSAVEWMTVIVQNVEQFVQGPFIGY